MIRSKVILAILLQALIYINNVTGSPFHRIIDGDTAHKHQFPWHVSLIITLQNSDQLRYCGASLISKDYLLTAASCLQHAQKIRCDMGSTLFLEPMETQESTLFISHNQYNAELQTNNIGLIRLPKPVAAYSNTLRAILIPGASHANELYVNEPTYISGYGVYEMGGNHLSNNLRFAHETTLTNQQCQESFNSQLVPNSAICTKGNGTQTACYGDVGGPLVIQYQETWMQIGIASKLHSSGCYGPTVFTRLTSYHEWIKTMTGISNDF